MNKRLSLKKETLARLDNDELAEVLAGTGTATNTCVLCAFTEGNSCGGVCSGYCPTYTCGTPAVVTEVVTKVQTVY